MKTFLHVGCGPKRKDRTTSGFAEWSELRFDIDESVQPDLVGTMTDMSSVSSDSVDAVFSSHNIEHLYPHEVPVALSEFLRVLKPDGFAVITCPDLQAVCALVAEDKLTEPAYTSPAGPIAPLDILYGHRPPMARGKPVYGSPLWVYRESAVWNPTILRFQKSRLHEAGCSLL
jgi:SAM-dependent methyltransferase